MKENLWTIIVIDKHSTQNIFLCKYNFWSKRSGLFVSKPCQQNLTPQANLSVTYSDLGLNYTVYQ